MVANSKPCYVTSSKNEMNVGSLNNDYSSSTGSFHKSFDFSNVNLINSFGTDLRQYHQTRLFIKDFENMSCNGEQCGNSNSTYIISSNLPETFSYKIGSQWSAPLSEFGSAGFNLFMQTAGKAIEGLSSKYLNTSELGLDSGINRVTTLRMWDGTYPLSLNITIPVVDDDYSSGDNSRVRVNLSEALEFLGCLSLPKDYGKVGYYSPPPSPLMATVKWTNDSSDGKTPGKSFTLGSTRARIMLQLGSMLLVDNCILEEVTVNYKNTKGQMLRNSNGRYFLSPIFAEVSLKISTIEAVTSKNYSKMLSLSSQPIDNVFDLTSIGDKVESMINKGKSLFSGTGGTK